uniref:Uncharacterized protein n=1 Tax=Pristionchus pacificus TaxID=54126 RepID=A0A2A6C5P8_PRIPA|eukprot:PDM73436.1 hypothetical protein PRIPAC_40792 [Pristionchus pacificus]
MSLSELRILILLTVQKKARLDEEGCGDRLTRAEHFAIKGRDVRDINPVIGAEQSVPYYGLDFLISEYALVGQRRRETTGK